MKSPTFAGCGYDADLFSQRVAEYVEFVKAEVEAKSASEQYEREAWAATLNLRADDYDWGARNDPDNAEYCRGMAESYREMARKTLEPAA